MSPCKAIGFLVFAAAVTGVVRCENLESEKFVEFSPLNTNPLLFEAGGQPIYLDMVLRKFLMPLGMISPYFSLFDPVEDFPGALSGLFTRRLRGGGRSLGTAPARSPKQNIKHFTGTLHDVLGGNIFNPDFAEQLIDELPELFSQQLSALIDAVGGNLLQVLADAESPAAVVFQQIIAPLEGDGLLFLIPESFDGSSSPSHRVLQEVSTSEVDADSSIDNLLPLSSTEWESLEVTVPSPVIQNNMEARSVLMSIAREIGEPYGVGDLYANLAATFTDEFLLPGGVAQEAAALLLEAKEQVLDPKEKLLESWDPLTLFQRSLPSMTKAPQELTSLLNLAAKVGGTLGAESFFVNVARTFYWFLVPLKIAKPICDLLLSRQESLLKVAALKATILSKSSGASAVMSILGPKALTALAVKKGIELLKLPLLLNATNTNVPLKELWSSDKWRNPLASVKILKSAVQIGDSLGKGLLYMAVAKAVIQALFEPLGITGKIADLLSLRMEEVMSMAQGAPSFPDISFVDVLESLQPDTMSRVGDSKKRSDRHDTSYDSIVQTAIQIGEKAGNSALLGALTTFFLDSVVEPLGLTETVADLIPHDSPLNSVSTEEQDKIDVNEMVENLMTAMVLA